MDCHHCITESAERKKGQHLRMEDRGAIKVLKKQGLGPRAIARQIGCAPSTVTNELRRGTPTRKSNKGKAPGYSPSWEKLSTEPTEHPATGIRKRASAITSPAGWLSRSGNTRLRVFLQSVQRADSRQQYCPLYVAGGQTNG